MTVHDAIQRASALLPGEPATEDQKDPRWQAIIAIGEFIEAEPQAVWEFISTWGRHDQEDLRTAIATCLLEHLLEVHFAKYFPEVERLTRTDSLFADTFLMCRQFGQSQEPGNATQFESLGKRLRNRGAQGGRKHPTEMVNKRP